VSGFFVIVTREITKHPSYTSIVCTSTNQAQRDDCSLQVPIKSDVNFSS
jgi:hypothetical protein